MVKRFMNDSAPDTREHFAEPLDIEETAGRIGTRSPQKNVVGLMLAQHVVDKVGGNRELAARFLLAGEAFFNQSGDDRTASKCALHQRRFREPGLQIVTKHILIE